MQKRGGLEKYTKRLADGFSQKGHDVTLLTSDKKSRFSLYQLLQYDRYCKKYIESEKPDIIFGMERNFCLQTHYRAGNGCHAAYLERRKMREGIVKRLSFALNPLHKLILAMEKKTFESPDLKKLFVNSALVEREILTHYPAVEPDKIVVVHNGVEWHELEKPFEEGFTKPRLWAYQFLFVGNEYERKGLNELLEALGALTSEQWELTVIGKERNPKHFYQKVADLGLEKKVHFLGQVSDVRPYYSKADCLVIPSRYDPFANVTVEALAMGLLVISSTHNGGHEVLKSPNFIYNSQEELENCLKQALKHPKTHLSATVIRNSIAHLDFKNQIQKVIDASI